MSRTGEPIHEDDRVVRDARVRADAERVWQAWTDPERIAEWFVDRAVGRADRRGARVTWAWDRFGMEVEQEVAVAEAPRRLVLTSRLPGGAHVLEVTIESDGAESVVRVVESGFGDGPEAEIRREGTGSGWVLAFALLAVYLERWYGRGRTELLLLRPVGGACGLVRPYYRTAAGIASWLTAEANGGGDEDPDAPPPRRLVLRDGRTITGDRLAQAGHEHVRLWEEVGGTLEFKAFPVPDGGCVVGLRVSSWTLPQAELDEYEPVLDAAVERLVERLG